MRAHILPRAKAKPHRTCKLCEVVPTLWSEQGVAGRKKVTQTKPTDASYLALKAKINEKGMPETNDGIPNKCKAIGGWRVSYRMTEVGRYGPKNFSARLRAKVSALNAFDLPQGRRHRSKATELMKAQARQLRRNAASRAWTSMQPRPSG